MSAGEPSAAGRCAQCGTELPSSFLACPSCGALVHAAALKALAAAAEQATAGGDTKTALVKWREAQALLPQGTRQRARVDELVKGLSAQLDGLAGAGAQSAATPAAGAPSGGRKRGPIVAALAAVGALLAKFKFAIVFLLAKGKLLLAGLFQAKTFFSMALALGVYATIYGWRFAVGLIVSIYIHEMGHVERLRHYGIAATAPMFIPGFGALVRLKQYPATPREDARVGLAGPLWGLGAALAALALGRGLGYMPALAVASVGAWINLFNLVPVWQLDGGRAFNALSRRERLLLAGLVWILALMGIDGMLYLVAIGASFRAAKKDAPEEGDQGAFLLYSAILLGLVAVMLVAKHWGVR